MSRGLPFPGRTPPFLGGTPLRTQPLFLTKSLCRRVCRRAPLLFCGRPRPRRLPLVSRRFPSRSRNVPLSPKRVRVSPEHLPGFCGHQRCSGPDGSLFSQHCHPIAGVLFGKFFTLIQGFLFYSILVFSINIRFKRPRSNNNFFKKSSLIVLDC